MTIGPILALWRVNAGQVQNICSTLGNHRPQIAIIRSVQTGTVGSQAAGVFIDELASRGLEVMTAPGEAIHIDWVNTTSATPDELIQQASKTYLDWYLLTQVRRGVLRLHAMVPGKAGLRIAPRLIHAGSGEGAAVVALHPTWSGRPGQVSFHSSSFRSQGHLDRGMLIFFRAVALRGGSGSRE